MIQTNECLPGARDDTAMYVSQILPIIIVPATLHTLRTSVENALIRISPMRYSPSHRLKDLRTPKLEYDWCYSLRVDIIATQTDVIATDSCNQVATPVSHLGWNTFMSVHC